MTTVTQNPTVERYRRMVEIIDNCGLDEAYAILTNHIKTVRADLKPYYELVVSKSAEYSYRYARDKVKGRFKLGENEISKSAKYSYQYAKEVIKGRFELGEEAISKDAYYSHAYARDVIKGRFELGEEAISKDKETLANYAFDVIKGRLPEHLEKILLSDEETEAA